MAKNREVTEGVELVPTEKKKRSPNKPNVMTLVKSLDANAIRARLAELESEQSALKALLTVAEARDTAKFAVKIDGPTA